MKYVVFAFAVGACGSTPTVPAEAGTMDASTLDVGVASDAPAEVEAAPPCTTRVTYGAAWIHPGGHPATYDDAPGTVTWDGTYTNDGPNSYATLSNGWKPYFTGNDACILALDAAPSCNVTTTCTTRVTYGAGWEPPANHPASYDDVPGRVFSDGVCVGGTYANLSNGWQPHFSGGACPMSFDYTQCGGLYTNAVIPTDCPDPGVLHDGDTYVLTCTSGDAASAFPIYTSSDLASWTPAGHVFPAGMWPSWAVSDFWAPEIHLVGSHYVVYFSARGKDGVLAIGAAYGPTALGPFTDPGVPLVHDPNMGLIDASEINAGSPYVLWKEDGNAVGKQTPIHSQELAADGLSLVGSPSTLITNDQPWEGAVTEGPFMVEHGGMFYLFYSGNSYANASYAVGVARGSSPIAAMTKASAPILVTGGAWAGPGHCAVTDALSGDTAIVYHAWPSTCVGGPGCGREDLVDTISWGTDGWPSVLLAPSSTTRPLP
jgi:arabinan endo-1,5-alpha-L-arabinosidase